MALPRLSPGATDPNATAAQIAALYAAQNSAAPPPPGTLPPPPPAPVGQGTFAGQNSPQLGGGSAAKGLDAGTYVTNPDGTLTIVKDSASHSPDAPSMVGSTVTAQGQIIPKPGSPLASASKGDLWLGVTPSGQPATANPNYKSNAATQAVDIGADAITKDNPIAGQVRAGVDIATGKGSAAVGNDLANGFTGGTIGVDPKTGSVTTGDMVNHAVDAAPTGVSIPGLGGLGGAAGSVDTGAISAAAARSAGLSDQFNNQYLGYQNIAPPVAQSQQIGSTVQAGTQAPIQAGQSVAGQSTAAQIAQTVQAQQQAAIQAQQIQGVLSPQQQAIQSQQVQAAIAQKQNAIQAQNVQGAQVTAQNPIYQGDIQAAQAGRTTLGPAALADGATLGRAALADQTKLGPAALTQAATIDQSQQAQFRAGQTGLISGLQGAINGTDPSVAAIMLRQATERNQANQFANAAAASGMNTGLAQRQAMIGAADINQQSIGQQALLRAQEIATARGQLGSVLDQGRGQDVSLASQQASLQQGANLANQGATNTASLQQGQMDQATKLANAGFTNTQAMTAAQLQQAVSLANAGFRNTQMTTQAQLDAATAQLNVQQQNSVGIQNASNSLEAQKANQAMYQQAALANQASSNQASLANQSANLAAGTSNATLGQQVNLANQNSLNTVGLGNASNALAAGTTNAQLSQQVALANAAAQNSANQSNQSASLAAGTSNATLAQQVALANAAAGNATNAQNATMANQTGIANAGNQTQTGVANANNVTSANTASSQLANQVALANAAAGNQTNQTNAQLGTQTNIANAGNATTTAGQNIAAQNNLATNALTGSGQAITGAVGAAQAQATASAAQAQQNAALIGGGAAVLGKLVSDQRAKTDIRPGGLDVNQFLADLSASKTGASRYRYKDPGQAGAADGEHFGPMAQDLERTRVGRTLVSDTPTGKMVDSNRAAMVALAALAELNKRVSKVEAR